MYQRRCHQVQSDYNYHQHPFYRGAYEKYLDDVMRMCDLEEARLQKSMFDLRKVRRYWRDFGCNDSEEDNEKHFNSKNDHRHSDRKRRGYRYDRFTGDYRV